MRLGDLHSSVAKRPCVLGRARLPRPRSLRSQAPMQANAKPTDAARDGDPDAEEPAPTKMDDQHYKLGPAMPVRTQSLTCANLGKFCPKPDLMCKPVTSR